MANAFRTINDIMRDCDLVTAIPPQKIIKPPWDQMKADLEKYSCILFQGYFYMRLVLLNFTQADLRTCTRRAYIVVNPAAYLAIQFATKYFEFTEAGYDEAFKWGVALCDEDKIEYTLFLKQNQYASRELRVKVKKSLRNYREKRVKYYDPAFIEWKEQVADYCQTLGVQPTYVRYVEGEKINQPLYVRWKAGYHFMDVAFEILNTNAWQGEWEGLAERIDGSDWKPPED